MIELTRMKKSISIRQVHQKSDTFATIGFFKQIH